MHSIRNNKGTTLKTHQDLATEEAEKRIARAAVEGARELSLSGLPLESLPASLAQLRSFRTLDLEGSTELTDLSNIQLSQQLQSLNLSYCRQIQELTPLSGLAALQSLNLSGCSQIQELTPLGSLAALQSLNLSECSQIQELTPLASLAALQSLDLTNCSQIQKLNPLEVLIALKSLSLHGCGPIQELTPLASLTALQSVNLNGCGQIQELTPLASLTALQSLNLNGCGQIQELTPLASLTALQSLNLSACSQIQELTPLASLAALQSLNLSYCSQIQELTPLASLAALQSLNLSYCSQIQELTPLAGLAALQSLNLSFCRQIQELTPLAGLAALQSLNLSFCRQIQELTPLAGLAALQSLDLSACRQIQELTPLASVAALQSLNLSECSQIQELTPLASLAALQSLNLSACSQIQELTPLASLAALQSLNLRGCSQIQELTPLASLAALQSLSLSACSQIQELTPLASLAALQSLNLSYCSQIQELTPLASFAALQSLNLSYCSQIQELTPLASLAALQSLDLSGCSQIQELTPLASLAALQSLDLRDCSQIQELTPLASLAALRSLDLSGCSQIQELTPLASLAALQSLNLSGCSQIQELTPLAALNALRSLNLMGIVLNCGPGAEPFTSLFALRSLYADRLASAPQELASKDSYSDSSLARIRAWQKDLLAGEAPNSTVKIFILGNGRIGKTQISRRLRQKPFDRSIPSTHGISVNQTQVAPAQNQQPAIIAKLWDFGGQDIYLGTHGLFLDDRAIYVLAWTPQHENTDETEQNGILMRNRPLTYWLEYVRSIAGPEAPIIIVQTQCDRELDERTPDIPANHGFKRLRIISSNATQDDGVERLQLELKSDARYQFEQYGKVRLPASWLAIADELHSRKAQKTIPFAEFETLCRAKYSSAAPSVVLEYLHRSGQVFFRSGAFDNQVVLDLDWALAGVYALLDRDKAVPFIRKQAGRFSPQLLATLVWQEYSTQDHDLFLSLMQQCQICFKVTDDVFIAPAHLPMQSAMSNAIQQVWRDAKPDAIAKLEYSFLHEGVLRAILCGLGEKAGAHAEYWAYGICFYDAKAHSTARITSYLPEANAPKPSGYITLEAVGPQAAALVNDLIASIKSVNIGQAPDVVWQLGQPGAKASPETETPEGATKPFASIQPARPPAQNNERQPVYVSYAWGGESEKLVDGFEQNLPPALHLIRDKRAMRPGDWISKFMTEIGRSDCVLLVLSAKYLQSVYCMRELLYLFNASLGERAAMMPKLIPMTVGNLSFARAIDRTQYVAHWQKERKDLEEQLEPLGHASVGDNDRAELLAIMDFQHRISDILSWVADTLNPQTLDDAIKLASQRRERAADAR